MTAGPAGHGPGRRREPGRIARFSALAILAMLPALLEPGCNRHASRAPALEDVSILRDGPGTPHIFAATTEGAFFGLGWAVAEDRLLQMELTRRIMRGRLAEILSPSEFQAVLRSDVRARSIGWGVFADALAPALSRADTRAILRAYSDGVNAQVRSRGGQLPAGFTRFGISSWEPWTPADCLLAWMRIQDLFDRDWEREFGAKGCGGTAPIVDASGAVVPCADAGPPCFEPHAATADVFRHASHDWAVAGSRTTTGRAVLVGAPVVRITAPSLWYEFQVSGGDMDARGIGVAGCPGIFTGWNHDIAWAVTAMGVDGGDLFELKVSGKSGTDYELDGATVPMTQVRTETIQVLGADPVSITHKETIFGPVVTPFLAFACGGGGTIPTPGGGSGTFTVEHALRHVALLHQKNHSVETLLDWMRAKSWTEAREAMASYSGPAFHWLFADRRGHIGYTALASVPLRAPSPTGCEGKLPQDGKTAASMWLDVLPPAALPCAFDPPAGYLASANNLAAPPSCVAGGFILGRTGDSIRSWRLREILGARLGDPGAPPMSPQEIASIRLDTVNPSVRVFSELAILLLEKGALPAGSDAEAAALWIRAWRDTSDPRDLWHLTATTRFFPLLALIGREVVNSFRSPLPLAAQWGGGEPGLASFLRGAELDLATAVSDPDVQAWVIQVLAATWTMTAGAAGSPPGLSSPSRPAIPALVTVQSNAAALCAKSCTAAGFDCSLLPEAEFRVDLRAPLFRTLWSQAGNSYTQVVDFSSDAASQSQLPPGVSEDPASPRFRSAESAWLQGTLEPAPLDEARVRALATSEEHVAYPTAP